MTDRDDDPPPEKAGNLEVRDASGRFRKGQSGNPAGPPRGTKHWASRMAEALIDGEGDAITRVVIQKALAGEDVALRICMDRLLPPRKFRTVRFDLPRLTDAPALLAAHQELMQAVAEGELAPGEAAEISALFKEHRELIVLAGVTDRIAAIERLLAAGARPPDGDDEPSPSNARRYQS